jgi:succinate-semialdehyde dehydrogenase/glutarate-semialdehyde dehydrogenase
LQRNEFLEGELKMSVSEAPLEAEMFIDGKRQGGGLELREIRNPATGELVGSVPSGTESEADQAVDAANQAFDSWWSTPAAKRGELVMAAAGAVRSRIGELSVLLTSEQGKPLREARIELTRFCDTLEHYAGLSKSLRGGYVPDLDEAAFGQILKRPLGVVAAIIPWNFPTTLLANKLGPALVTGNTVVAKPADTTPLTTVSICQIMHEAGIPSGVLNVVTGRGSIIGEALATHPLVSKVAFTGSTPVGRRIMTLASGTTKRVTLELGGSDPLIVLADADIDKAASAASVGRFFNCGQACLAVKRVFVAEEVADALCEKLVEKARRLTVGDPMADGTRLGPLHTDTQRSEVAAQVEDAAESGAEVMIGGKRPQGEQYDHGFFYEPTLVHEPAQNSRVATEEVFGPALPIWRVRDLEEALGLANSSIYGLGSSIWTRDLDAASYAAQKLHAGYTWVNSPQKIYDELPFGGMGQSGFGKEHGNEALDYYLESKSVVIRRQV